jgi:hypothetical protein
MCDLKPQREASAVPKAVFLSIELGFPFPMRSAFNRRAAEPIRRGLVAAPMPVFRLEPSERIGKENSCVIVIAMRNHAYGKEMKSRHEA